MQTLLLTLKLLFYCYLGYLLFFLATGYHPEQPGYNPPFAIFVLDTINLFIHEAGHFFLKVFGKFIHILGGSFFQILLPGLLVFTTWRQKISSIAAPGFWLGENLVNVSVYIRDAPFRQLRLIARLHGRTVEEEVEAIVLEKIRQAEDVITGDRPSRVPEKDC